MSSTTSPRDRFASLFVDVTGRDTLTQHQRDDDARRDYREPEAAVSTYVADATQQTGLDDAIDTPDTQ